MKTSQKNFWRKADDGSLRTIPFAALIGVVLILTVGITIAQETQGNTVVQLVGETIAVDDCPCHQVQRPTGDNGGVHTADVGNYVCPSVLDGISFIQSQGENWYNGMIATVIFTELNLQTQQTNQHGNTISLIDGDKGIHHGIGHQIPVQGISLPMIRFLSWDELQQRFAVIEAYAAGTGPVPEWWTPEMLQQYTSPTWCYDARLCLELGVVIEIIIVAFMALTVAGTNSYGALLLLGVSSADAMLVITCLAGAG